MYNLITFLSILIVPGSTRWQNVNQKIETEALNHWTVKGLLLWSYQAWTTLLTIIHVFKMQVRSYKVPE